MAEITITKENFESEVINSNVPVLIDFWASWCGPCKMLAPIVEEIAEEYDGKVKVCKVNVDDQPELAMSFNVNSIPLVVVMENGKVTNSSIGYVPKEELLAILPE